jgi:hypothetical protein
MPSELSRKAYKQLFDEDIEWLLQQQPRTLERDHIRDCLIWLRDNRPKSISRLGTEAEEEPT